MSAKFSIRHPLAHLPQRSRVALGVSCAVLLLMTVATLAGLGLQAAGGELGAPALAVLLAAAVVAGTGLGLLLSHSRTSPLVDAADLDERIAEGDLSADLDPRGEAELARLQSAVAQMQGRLRDMLGSVHEAQGFIASAAVSANASATAPVSAGPATLSPNLAPAACPLAPQASALPTPASPDALVASAVAAAKRGGEVVAQVAANMEDIANSSRKIGETISVIDSIAFQTNLLALNAAVQAAHVGQAGAGFKVVAGEVRNLAQRAASAAKEIKSLINASVEKVESGGQLVRDAGTTMEHIVSSVQSVTEIIRHIGSHTSEQGEGLQLVSLSVTKLDEMTQRNTALVTESASAAESLRSQADRLQKVVGAFRLLQQTQEAAWTAHTAISSARERAKASANPASSGEAVWGHERRTPPPSTDSPQKGDWESF